MGATAKREITMNRAAIIVVGLTTLLYVSPTIAVAQNAPPSYTADPDVYTVIFEDQNLRVISSSRKAGATDKPHSHPVPSVIFFLSDCDSKLTTPDGKSTVNHVQQSTAQAIPVTPNHTVQNVGSSDCEAIIVERK
jgi:hypothetical protein